MREHVDEASIAEDHAPGRHRMCVTLATADACNRWPPASFETYRLRSALSTHPVLGPRTASSCQNSRRFGRRHHAREGRHQTSLRIGHGELSGTIRRRRAHVRAMDLFERRRIPPEGCHWRVRAGNGTGHGSRCCSIACRDAEFWRSSAPHQGRIRERGPPSHCDYRRRLRRTTISR